MGWAPPRKRLQHRPNGLCGENGNGDKGHRFELGYAHGHHAKGHKGKGSCHAHCEDGEDYHDNSNEHLRRNLRQKNSAIFKERSQKAACGIGDFATNVLCNLHPR